MGGVGWGGACVVWGFLGWGGGVVPLLPLLPLLWLCFKGIHRHLHSPCRQRGRSKKGEPY